MVRKLSVVLSCAVSAAVMAMVPVSGSAQNSGYGTTASTAAVRPDNTKMNRRDRSPASVTADQQKETQSDRMVTKKIRESIMSDSKLSTYAHNIKIVTRGGRVTLKGPVRTSEEKSVIEQKAVEVVGQNNVINEIEIAPAKK